MYKFSDVFEFQKKSKIKAGDGQKSGLFPFYTSSAELSKYVDNALFDGESLVFGTGGNASVHFADSKFSVSTDCLVAQPKTKDINAKFVYHYLFGNIRILEEGFKGAGLKHISKGYISDINLPKVSRSKQDKIVSVLDHADSLRQKRKEQLALLDDYLKSVFSDMFGDPIEGKKWGRKPLEKVADVYRGRFSPRPRNDPSYYNGDYPFIQTGDISNSEYRLSRYTQTLNDRGIKVSKCLPKGTIAIAIVGATIGATTILGIDAYAPDSVIGITVDEEKASNRYIEYVLRFLQTYFCYSSTRDSEGKYKS